MKTAVEPAIAPSCSGAIADATAATSIRPTTEVSVAARGRSSAIAAPIDYTVHNHQTNRKDGQLMLSKALCALLNMEYKVVWFKKSHRTRKLAISMTSYLPTEIQRSKE